MTQANATIPADWFSENVFALFTETFERVVGIYLDRGTSLFETLDTISAEEASRPVSADCAMIATQVEHIRFYLEVMEQYAQGQNPGKVDWGAIWRDAQPVNEEAWENRKAALKTQYQRIIALFQRGGTWTNDGVGGVLAIITHTAYHLGEIRQAMCTVKAQR